MPQALTHPERIELRIESDPANLRPVREAIEQFAVALGFAQEDVDDLGLVVNEALANVIRHAYLGKTDRPIEFKAWTNGHGRDELTVSIRDWGNGVDPSSLVPKYKDPLVPGGLGLLCMKKMMDDVRYIRQTDGMLLEMKKRKGETAGGA